MALCNSSSASRSSSSFRCTGPPRRPPWPLNCTVARLSSRIAPEKTAMARILVLYYSSYGHIERMAQAVADGVRDAGSEPTVKRVPETVPEEVARKSGFKLDQKASVAAIDDLAQYDGVAFGTPT